MPDTFSTSRTKTILTMAQKYLPEDAVAETANDVFVLLAKEGSIRDLENLVRDTRGFPSEEIEEMIHGNNDEAFFSAVKNGHLKVIKYLVALTQDSPQKQQDMIHASGSGELQISLDSEFNVSHVRAHHNKAFAEAVSQNHVDVVRYLIEQTPEIETVNRMIKGDTLLIAVENNSPEMVLCLLEAISNHDQEMLIHDRHPSHLGSSSFNRALEKDYFEVANVLMNNTPRPRAKELMIDRIVYKIEETLGNLDLEKAILIMDTTSDEVRENFIEKIGQSIDVDSEEFIHLLEIAYNQNFYDVFGFQRNPDLIRELQEVRTKLISEFGEQDLMAQKKANSVIATLLTGENLEKIKEYHESSDSDFPLDLQIQSEQDKKTVIDVLRESFCKPLNEPKPTAAEQAATTVFQLGRR